MKKLLNGMRQDEVPVDQPEGSWRDARNIVVQKAFGSVSNEDGADNITPNGYPSTKICIGTIIMGDAEILFFGTTNPNDSEIGIKDATGAYTPILIESSNFSEVVLNFNQNFPIQGTFENKYNNSRVIAWGDRGYNPPRILSIDCFPFNVNPTTHKIVTADIVKARDLINLFPSYETPLLEPDNLEVKDGQGALITGTYYPIVAYELQDGTVISWSKVFNGVPIYSDNQQLKFEQVGGNQPNEPTNKAISIKFTKVDTNYKFLRIGYVSVIDGVTSASYVSKYPITSTNLDVEILGNETTLLNISLDSVLIPNAIYNGNQSITNLQGKLLLANVTTETEINLQPYTNKIKVEWIREKDISVHGIVKNIRSGGSVATYGSYKDGSLVVFDKGFKAGECYALYVAARLKAGGVWTKAFHIPGRNTIAGDKDGIIANTLVSPVGDAQDLDSGNEIPKYEILDTSTQVTADSGLMGFWENENEEYPLNAAGNAVHVDYIDIPGISTGNRKVRHHVFPDLQALKGYAKPFTNLSPNTILTKTNTIISGGVDNPAFEINNCYYDNITASGGNTPAAYAISQITFSGNDRGTRISSFVTPGVLTINNNFYNVPFPSSGNCSFFPASWDSGGYSGKMQLHWTLSKNGSLLKEYSYEVGMQSPYPVLNDPATYLWATSASFANFTGFQIPVVPGDNIDIEFHIQVPGSNGTVGTAGSFDSAFGSSMALNFQSGSIDSQPLGIKITNFFVNPSIIDKIDCFEIFYAKRTSNNIRVVAQDMVKEARFHAFDLMTTKTSAQISYLKPVLEYSSSIAPGTELQDTVTSIGGVVSEVAYGGSKILFVQRFLYVGANTLLPVGANIVNNTNKADSIYIEAGNGVVVTNPQAVLNTYQLANTLFDMCVFRRNVYQPFQSQELVSTGYAFKPDKSSLANVTINNVTFPAYIQPDYKVYGGDIYINAHGFRDSTTTNTDFYMSCESASNIGLRFEDVTNSLLYFPKNTSPTPSFYGYNRDYNAINDFNQLDIFYLSGDCNTNPINMFPFRIPFSITDANESKLLNWRIFKANSYYEMPKDKGVIYNILGVNRTLYIHHLYSLFVAEIKDRINTGGGEVFLGFSDIFDRPPVEVIPVNHGFAGNQSQFATIICRLGYCSLDRQSGRLFVCNNLKLEEISHKGMYNFFKNKAQTSTPIIDNPYIGHGYSMAFDEQQERLIVVKLDENGFPFTISYSPSLNNNQGAWIGFHDYAPNLIYYNRNGVHSIDNTQKKVFRHNSKTLKGVFFNGQPKRCYIDTVFNEYPKESKRYENMNWQTRVEQGGGVLEQKTLTHITIYNNNQCSGTLTLNPDNGLWYGKDARNIQGGWNFNQFVDIVKNQNLAIMDGNNQVISSNLNNSKDWFDKSKFISKFVITRFEYDNVLQADIHIVAVDSNYIKSDR